MVRMVAMRKSNEIDEYQRIPRNGSGELVEDR
jgi:hypothetical protein